MQLGMEPGLNGMAIHSFGEIKQKRSGFKNQEEPWKTSTNSFPAKRRWLSDPTMISPCDPAILSNNPQFKALHQQLTTAILNPDGSTRAHAADPSRRAVQADLKKYLGRAVKARILTRVVAQVAVGDGNGGLDDEASDTSSSETLFPSSFSTFNTPPIITIKRTKINKSPRTRPPSSSLFSPQI
ncbi:hypothetical protein I7I51_01479 [Histoplasma capsulatum]|uniref:Uncharacterized protein n=1 Tax=Ajellomyces capsulatus TaxID=5037 RepID=A0A8A1MIM0_AJECA|nr:hypothetical protein I7I51_01479 [Histoplasma capsulatum]